MQHACTKHKVSLLSFHCENILIKLTVTLFMLVFFYVYLYNIKYKCKVVFRDMQAEPSASVYLASRKSYWISQITTKVILIPAPTNQIVRKTGLLCKANLINPLFQEDL